MGLGMYSVTKTALLGMTKVLSKDLAPIRVNCCAPVFDYIYLSRG